MATSSCSLCDMKTHGRPAEVGEWKTTTRTSDAMTGCIVCGATFVIRREFKSEAINIAEREHLLGHQPLEPGAKI
jgi:hypothetical protein